MQGQKSMVRRVTDTRPGRWLWGAAVILCAAAAGCGGDGDGDGDGTGGGGAGAGGGGTGAGGGGAGGAGGSSGACLDPAEHAGLFSILDPDLCAVALYTADVEPGSPTWGRHGGPLLVRPAAGGAAEIVRLSPSAGAAGVLTEQITSVDAGVPAGAFLGGQAIDLPFFDWSAISWTGAFPDTQGELLLVTGGSIAIRYPVNGFYSGAGIAAAGGGRLLYTGLSVLGQAAAGASAVYAADTCGADGQDPRLLPEGDASCPAAIEVAAWGDFSGPVTVDRDGNAFVILPSFAGTQEARAFPAASMVRGAGPSEGTAFFTLPGSGSSLTALAPGAGSPGLVLFQPSDPSTFLPLDPVAARYTAGAAIQPEGEPAAFLQLATPGTALSLTADDADRLWVGAPSPNGGTTFVVLARR